MWKKNESAYPFRGERSDFAWWLCSCGLVLDDRAGLSAGDLESKYCLVFNADMKEAHRNIESITALETICGEINNMVLKQDTLIALNIAYISESIRRAGEYAGDISETVINLLVEDEIRPPHVKSRK